MRKWKCVSNGHSDGNKERWTVGRIYETNEKGKGLIADDGDSGFVEPWCFSHGIKFEEVKEFTKADLKPCMIVELRSGSVARIEQTIYGIAMCNLSRDNSWNELKYYSEDLLYNGSSGSSWDIIKVYGFSECGDKERLTSVEYRELLWERIEKSPTQLKLEELENKQREIADEIKKIMDAMGNVDITVKLDGAKFGRMVVKDNE